MVVQHHTEAGAEKAEELQLELPLGKQFHGEMSSSSKQQREMLSLTEGNHCTLKLHAFLFEAQHYLLEAEPEDDTKDGSKKSGATKGKGSKKKANRAQKKTSKPARFIDNEKLSAGEVSFNFLADKIGNTYCVR